ncbi:MAG: transcriptional repressor [Paludibacter sp.]|nr:transcriptional repressor [Paludibacter sp.]
MKEHNQLNTANEIFTAFLTKKNLRKTPERFAILKLLHDTDDFLSVETIFETMKNDYRVSVATIYNTLELLLACHLIVKHQFLQNQTFYERISSNNLYFYKVCTACGKIKKFTDKNIRIALSSKSDSKFTPQHQSLYIYGLCSGCENEN